MNEEIFIARQPILDRNESLFAYELLFRKKQGDTQTSIMNDEEATAQVLDNALNNVGISKLVGKHRAFINCSYEFLTSEILYMLDSSIFVLEILESVEIDYKVIDAVKDFRSKGYIIAIDDFIPNAKEFERIAPLIPYTNIVKIDFPLATISGIENAVKFFHSKNIKVLAEKIETEKDFKECMAAKCDFFQGYFFSKPENLSASKINAKSIDVFELLKAVDSGLEVDKLERQFKNRPELSVNLIKYLNSAAFAMRAQVTSIRHAISLLGYSNLKRWLLILAYANQRGGVIESSPLLNNAIQRGIFFEEIVKTLNLERSTAEKAYLTGLISHLDALYKIPMQSILEQMPIDSEISKAIINKQGLLGELLILSQAIEADNFEEIRQSLKNLSISMESITKALIKSYNTNGL